MTCKMCRERGKQWQGSDPKCAFPKGDKFTSENWNCATVNAIRDLADWSPHPSVDHRYFDDQHYATVLIDGVELSSGRAYALWFTWYKSRGCTEEMWLLGGDAPPRKPSEADLVAILRAFR